MRELKAEFDGVVIIFWADQELPARGRDLSTVGMTLVCTEAQLPDGAPVSVLFQLSGDDVFLRIDGSLVRDGTSVDPHTCDIRFVDLCDELRDRLEVFVRARTLAPVDVPMAGPLIDRDEESTRRISPLMLAELRRATRPADDAPTEGGVGRWI